MQLNEQVTPLRIKMSMYIQYTHFVIPDEITAMI